MGIFGGLRITLGDLGQWEGWIGRGESGCAKWQVVVGGSQTDQCYCMLVKYTKSKSNQKCRPRYGHSRADLEIILRFLAAWLGNRKISAKECVI